MITKFGKRLRKLRVDKDLTLRSMAQMLEVSAAYLSGIENGKYAVSDNFLNRFLSVYEIPPEQIAEYREDAAGNQTKIDNNNTSLINALARSRLSVAELEQIKNIIKQKESE